jgi:hypothetical protein
MTFSIRRLIPVRVWLVWHALHGRPIVYRVTYRHGSIHLGPRAFVADSFFDMPPALIVEPRR